MLSVDIIAVGRMKKNAQLALWQDYEKRMKWPLSLHEIEGKKPGEEQRKLLEKIDPRAFVFVLDERGKTLSSPAFAEKIDHIALEGYHRAQFVLGGADGHDAEMRSRANFLLSFGAQTWPHMLARIMLIEQIYRAQQILAGHPYHRE